MAPKLINRYANRKLYDTERSCYVTLDDIGEMVKAGDDLRIIDNRTNEDLTSVTLTQIIFEDQKRPDQSTILPLGALRGIIQSGGEILLKLSNPVTKVGDDIRRRAGRLEEESQAALKDFLDSTRKSLDDTQSRIDERVKGAVDQMTHVPVLREDLNAMQGRIQSLESEVKSLNRAVEEMREHLAKLGVRDSLPSQRSSHSVPV